MLESLPPDESGDEDTSDECYLNRHTPYFSLFTSDICVMRRNIIYCFQFLFLTPMTRFDRYEKSEQEKWKEHLAMVQGTDGLRGSRATSSFMKKARIEGEAKVTLKDLLDAGILNVGEEFTFKGQVLIDRSFSIFSFSIQLSSYFLCLTSNTHDNYEIQSPLKDSCLF